MVSNTENLIDTTRVARYDNGDETNLNFEILRYIKNPDTPPETDAEEL
jgi:hypothetical protein